MCTACVANGQRQTDRHKDRMAHLTMKYQPCGKRSQDDPSRDFCTVNVYNMCGECTETDSQKDRMAHLTINP